MRGLVVLAGLALAGCKGDTVEFECSEEEPCGFGATCVEGQCVAGRCSTSAQCPMEHYCDDRECVRGCENNDDCYPGYSCNEGLQACEVEACLETSVDCGYREFCNSLTGECYDAGGQYCKPCDVDNQTEDCGEGNYCLAGYCGVDCSGGRECPSGFECYPFVDNTGDVVTWQCFTYCWLYEDYEPGSFGTSPPDGLMLGIDACYTELEATRGEVTP